MTALPCMLSWSGSALALTPIERLGKNVFFDTISQPEDRQACASCHDPARGWTLPDSAINRTTVVAPGARPKRHGSIKTPSNAYASFSPPFRPQTDNPFIPPWEGGNFWDGRAEGYGVEDLHIPGGPADDDPFGTGNVSETVTLDDLPPSRRSEYARYLGPTADQALNPFPNKVEQNIRIRRVCRSVEQASYSPLYTLAFDEPISCKPKDFETSYKRLAVALAAWQASDDVNSFSSKRDKALARDDDGKFPLDGLTRKENLGHDIFYGVNDSGRNREVSPGVPVNARCTTCHNGMPQGLNPDPQGVAAKQLYSDNRYHNIGTPFNREIPDVAKGEKTGLTAHVTSQPTGFFRTPTLRNVLKGASRNFTKAYTHNGWFKNVATLVHFYNTRDVLPRCETLGIRNATEREALYNDCWPAPEFAGSVVGAPFIGNLGLRPEEEDALVAYIATLADQYTPRAPR